MYKLSRLRPIELNDLVRLGHQDCDGGYIVSKRQIENTEILLGFGIGEDWSFEEDFLKQKNAALFAYDASVSYKKLKKETLRFSIYSVLYFLLLKFKRAKSDMERARYFSDAAKGFKKFFTGGSRVFTEKFLSDYDGENYVSLETILKQFLDAKDFSIFIKMDVEGFEYRALPQIVPFFEKVNGLAIEFHELDILDSKFDEIMDVLLKNFYVAHIHANNSKPLIRGTDLPQFIELTLINKALFKEAPELSSLSYPVSALDVPCNPSKKDYVLDFKNEHKRSA